MFLATHLLRKAERRQAMAACPCGDDAVRNWNIALNLVRDETLETIDLFWKSDYFHEALCALVDGALLFNRAVANLRESKAAALYLARRQPLGWLDRPAPVLGSDDDRRLRHGIEEISIHGAAADLNDGLNQVANAIVRLAWEANLPTKELANFHLDGAPTSKWISWGQLARASKADPQKNVLPHFDLSKQFLACVDDPQFEFEYRHSRTHKAFPATINDPYLSREVAKSSTIRFPRAVSGDIFQLPDFEPTRQRLAETARLSTELLFSVLHFIPKLSNVVGQPIEISGHDVKVTVQGRPGKIAVPSHIVFSPRGGLLSGKVRQTVESSAVPRDRRDPATFLS